MLVRVVVIGSLAVGLLSHGLAPARADQSAPPAKQGAKPGAKPGVDVQAIYKEQCAICHGVDGKGKLPGVASFPDGDWEHGSRLQDIAKVIREGVPGTTMMAFKGRLKPEEIDALARHVRSFDKTLKPEK